MAFFVICGGHDIEIAKRSLELGAAAYITKPFDFACLREELARLTEPPPSNIMLRAQPIGLAGRALL